MQRHRRRRVTLICSLFLLVALLQGPSVARADDGSDGGSSPSNIVQVINQQDQQLRIGGRVQLNEITGSTADPVNEAYAYSSCTGCQTFAVALQIDLISTHATDIQPHNTALAINYRCTGCTTVAKAYQYVIQVPDPTAVPNDVFRLIREMNDRLSELQDGRDVSLTAAEAQINAVIQQFSELSQHLHQQQDQEQSGDGHGQTGG